ncbi:MAG: hypothetical protein SF051_06275 [Elusimicrobiota bacterium]|nr:hypothetical protein [Elusimicrobiota bacterium]
MTSIEDWIGRSWDRFKRRWWTVLAVSGVAGAAALLGGFLPALGGVLLAGAGPVWAVSGVAGVVSLLALVWLSTWAQAAAVEAAAGEQSIGDCLRSSWRKTGAFAWSLSLVMLAAGGAFYLLFLPGLWLSPLLFFAPFVAVTEGIGGVASLEASWRRVSGRWWAVTGRLILAGVTPVLIGLVPVVGWLLGIAAGPFSLVMLADLSDELRRLDPGDAAPAPRLGAATAALSVVFVAGTAFAVQAALLAAASLKDLIRSQAF